MHGLPVPDDTEVRDFIRLYEWHMGRTLPYGEARAMLTDMVQLYYLTKGHELHERNRRVLERLRRHSEVDSQASPEAPESDPLAQ